MLGKNEGDIESVPALALFMPLIAAMAGNVGVQSSAIVVQALASNKADHNMTKKLFKELSVGLVNGLILAAVMMGAGLILGYGQLVTLTVSVSF
jgi:magnesium transporter